MINVAQFSDLHFCPANLAESSKCFRGAIDAAITRKVDAAIITGDSTDHAMEGHTPALLHLAREIRRLSDHCPVLMLQGTFSHEPPGLLKMFAMIGGKFPVTIADRICTVGLTQDQFEIVETGKSYKALFHCLPTLNKADIAAITENQVFSASVAAGDIIANVLQSWSPVNRQARIEVIPSMVLSHGTVHNCLTEHGVPMAGVDHEFGTGTLFSADADAVALGHIHKHQSWESTVRGFPQTIAYPGSIGRFHYGEDGSKHWLCWSLSAGNTSFEAVETNSTKTVDIEFDGVPDLEALRTRASELIGVDVRIRYSVDAEHRNSVDREAMKAILVGCNSIQIQGKTCIVERSRAPGMSVAQCLNDKLVQWALITNSNSIPLTERLQALQTKDVDDIVATV